MPHKVATFFRSHTSASSDAAILEKKKSKSARISVDATHRNLPLRDSASSSASSIASSDSASIMPDNKHKRRSMTGTSPRSSSKSIIPQGPARLGVEIESPPLMFYGPASSSTGALLSGQLKLDVTDEKWPVETFEMKLVVEVRMKKPFHAHCEECIHQTTDLTTWKFLHAPTALNHGEHDFPFSFLLPGHLPATIHGALSSIEYVLKAKVTPTSGEPIILTRELNVKRAIQPSELPRQSVRIFPPTNLTAHVELPSVIHPIGEFNCSVRVDGIVSRNAETAMQHHWKLRRLNWRLDEIQKVISPACNKHAIKAGAGPNEKKGMVHQDAKTLNMEEMKTGWKADYSGPDGSIDLEFPFSIRGDANPICDVKAEDGTEISHLLVIELIVAEEIAVIRKPSQATPTGAARVLRMSFNVTVTERCGLGISWDEEQPPLYEDVPASPPRYGNSEEYTGAPIPEYEDLEHLRDEEDDFNDN